MHELLHEFLTEVVYKKGRESAYQNIGVNTVHKSASSPSAVAPGLISVSLWLYIVV